MWISVGKDGSLPIELSEIGQWWGTDPKKKKQIQIDIVGTPVESKDYIIGSCKYRNEKIGVDELDLIRDYASVFGKGNNYHYYIFSKGGFTDGLFLCLRGGGYANSIQNPGHSLDLNPIKIRKLLVTTGVYFPSTAAKLFCCSSKGKRTFTLVTW